jgi:uncharacterized membrane protein
MSGVLRIRANDASLIARAETAGVGRRGRQKEQCGPARSQSAYAQQEAKEPVRKATREKIAEALGIAAEQLAV